MTTTTRSHQTTLDALDRAREFLHDYPEVPTPTVQIDRGTGIVTMRWHLDREHDVALDVLRLFSGWVRMTTDSLAIYQTVTTNKIELAVFTSLTTTPAEPVNLLDALAEVTA